MGLIDWVCCVAELCSLLDQAKERRGQAESSREAWKFRTVDYAVAAHRAGETNISLAGA